MSDIFQEVDEEVRREQLKKLWERYGHYAVAAAIAAVIGVGVWRGYEWWEAKKAAESGAAFEAAATLTEEGKRGEAEAAFAKIIADGTAGYRDLARLREAAELAQTDPKAAIAAYDKIAANGAVGPVLRDLAALRAGALLVDAGSFAEARERLEPLAANDRTFRYTAREFLVLAAWRASDSAAAKRWSDMIMTDAQTPAATRSRVEMLMALGPGESKG
ncbi:MAG: tetratricopeptide repeat protein [Xanthobacteraceae bacterium]